MLGLNEALGEMGRRWEVRGALVHMYQDRLFVVQHPLTPLFLSVFECFLSILCVRMVVCMWLGASDTDDGACRLYLLL